MDIVNDQSDYVITLAFTDEDSNAVTPSSGSYRLDVVGGNAITGNNANAWVDFTPSNNTHDIAITANQNIMANASTDREERVLTTKFTYGANNRQGTAEYRYMLTRLKKLS